MKKLALLFLVLAPISIWSQDNFTIQSDRPGIGYNANTVGKGVVLHQFGYQWSRTLTSALYFDNHDLTSNLRIGVLDDLEVHWNLNYNGSYIGSRLSPSDPNYQNYQNISTNGLSLNSLGVRYTFLRGEQWKPTLAVMGDIETPLINEDYRTGKPRGNILLIANWNFQNGAFWGITTGITDIPNSYTFPYAINFGGYLGEKISLFIEYYGSTSIGLSSPLITQRTFTNGLDGGITYQPHRNIVLDLFGGYQFISSNLSSATGGLFISTGITWAIQAWNK